MEINEMLKSNDEEILILYVDLALKDFTINQINEMIKNKHYNVYSENGDFYLKYNYSRLTSSKTKLNFTFKK